MSVWFRRAAACGLVAAALAPAACGGGPEPEPPEDRDTIALADPAPPDTGGVAEADTIAGPADSAAVPTGSWTAGIVDIPSGDPEVSTLASVRAARHEGFDRVVWELEGPMPGIHVEYVDEPVRACGSGEAVALPGDAWLEVRITPVHAHTDLGRPTIEERRRAPDLPAVLEIVQTCDFEAVVTWVLAVRSPEGFRLTRLDDPARLVVDVRHRR